MNPLLIMFLTIVLVTAAVIDIRVQRIPNLLTYPAMAVAIGYHSVAQGVDGLLFSTGGLVVGTAIFFIPYLMGGMGAGDAKLMGAVGAMLGVKGVFIASLSTVIIGGIYAIVLLLIRRKDCKGFITRWATTLKTFVLTKQFISIPAGENEEKPKMCYGVAIAMGTILYVFLALCEYDFVI